MLSAWGGSAPRPNLARLAARLPPRPRTRFAPAPTGHLHLGHVVNAIYVWGLARALNGTVTLRIEDHDRTRTRAHFERDLLDDLEWLGFAPDEGQPSELRSGASTFRQRDAAHFYETAARELTARGFVFVCHCSRKAIVEAGGSGEHELRYPGICRGRGLDDGPGHGLRVRIDPGVETFDDGLRGVVVQEPASQCGDVLIRDRHGCWTYQFAVVVDDMRQDIDLVIRGEDLLPSTGRQIRLARLLGRERPPVFVHHRLIVRPDGAKLSKSNRDTGVRDLRADGHSADDVLGMAAHAAGLTVAPLPLSQDRIAGLFSTADSKSGPSPGSHSQSRSAGT